MLQEAREVQAVTRENLILTTNSNYCSYDRVIYVVIIAHFAKDEITCLFTS